ncbi:MAG TPA: LLM class flavin-dependent oxidoreductase [Anaerolineae bacterium]|jgi:alkanesulfonate monooxygenase SsuD/methylene tetrahydromethanopterin reductase-like flavin-dependent oxidoreductase (luciferase family)
MKYGFVLPTGDARTAADFASEAERAGWDGFFVWEPVWGVDAWISLTAAAMRTERIRLGTMISPLSRMRPWKLASEAATLDNLTGGRVILSVGLGAVDTGFKEFGEVTDRKTRAELLDESLDIITGLWRGQPFNYSGKHYTVRETTFMPPPQPVHKPRIPIWVVGAWPRPVSMLRALRYDGLLPAVMQADSTVRMGPPTFEELRQMTAYVKDSRPSDKGPFDFVIEGRTPGDDPSSAALITRNWEDAGATWWIEASWTTPGLAPVLERIKQGPPVHE